MEQDAVARFVGAPNGWMYPSHDGWWMCADGALRRQERPVTKPFQLLLDMAEAGVITEAEVWARSD